MCPQFVLLAGAAAVVEFCISMVLFSAHHQLGAVSAHVREVMRRPLPSRSEVTTLQLSEHEETAFYRAMDWADEMGNLDRRRVQSHHFSWTDQWHDISTAISGEALRLLVKSNWITEPRGDDAEGISQLRALLEEDDEEFKPLCARGKSSLRRRNVVTSVFKTVQTLGSQVGTAIDEFTEDLSADGAWHSLARQLDDIWNMQDISISKRAYEIAVRQQCLYTIQIRILQELKEVG